MTTVIGAARVGVRLRMGLRGSLRTAALAAGALLPAVLGLPAAASAADEAASPPPREPMPARSGPSLDARRWARAVFFDLRVRGPSPAELAALAPLEPEALVDRLLADPATWEAWLDRELYFYLLIDRFRPVSDRVQALPALLASGECTAKDATREVVVSAEFNARNPGNDTFVTVVLEQILGLVVQEKPKVLETGKKMYDGGRVRLFGELGDSQADFVRIVFERKEFADCFMARQYRQVFGKEIQKEDLVRDGARFHEEPAAFRGILRGWLLSDAYRARTRIPRPKSDLVFIRTLFVDLLGREPTFDEFRNSRNAFLALSDPAPVRNVLAQLLLDSGRAPLPAKAAIPLPGDWVRKEFLDLLGREPTTREREAFVAALGEYGCEPKTIVMAIATCPEYQYY